MDYGFSPNVSGPGVEAVFGGKSPSPRMERRTCVNSAGSLWPLVERSSDRGRGGNRQLIAIAVGIPGRTSPGSQQSSGACSGKLWEFAQQEICKTWYDMIWYDMIWYDPPPKKPIIHRKNNAFLYGEWRQPDVPLPLPKILPLLLLLHQLAVGVRDLSAACCGAPLGQVMGVIAGWVITENPIKIDDLTHFRKPRGGMLSWVITGLGTN